MWYLDNYPDGLYFRGNMIIDGFLSKPSISITNSFGNNQGTLESMTMGAGDLLSKGVEKGANIIAEGRTLAHNAVPGQDEGISTVRNLAASSKKMFGEVNKKFSDTNVSSRLTFNTYIVNDDLNYGRENKDWFEAILKKVSGDIYNTEELLIISSPNGYAPATDSDYEYRGMNVFYVISQIYGVFNGLLIASCKVDFSEAVCTNNYPAYIKLTFDLVPAKIYDIRMVEQILN